MERLSGVPAAGEALARALVHRGPSFLLVDREP
jgi:hypothetical protein